MNTKIKWTNIIILAVCALAVIVPIAIGLYRWLRVTETPWQILLVVGLCLLGWWMVAALKGGDARK